MAPCDPLCALALQVVLFTGDNNLAIKVLGHGMQSFRVTEYASSSAASSSGGGGGGARHPVAVHGYGHRT